MSSDDGGLAAADQAAAKPGPRSGFARHIDWDYDLASAARAVSVGSPNKSLSGGLGCDNRDYFAEAVARVFDQLEKVLLSKHADYGPTNISASPGGPLNGLRVRIHDKVARINHLLDKGVRPEHESLEDSFLDLANYAVIAVLVLRKQWPA